MQQMEGCGIETKLRPILRMGDITGICPTSGVGSTSEHTAHARAKTLQTHTGQAFEVMMQDTVDFDGPWLDVIDILDFFPGTQQTTIPRCAGPSARY